MPNFWTTPPPRKQSIMEISSTMGDNLVPYHPQMWHRGKSDINEGFSRKMIIYIYIIYNKYNNNIYIYLLYIYIYIRVILFCHVWLPEGMINDDDAIHLCWKVISLKTKPRCLVYIWLIPKLSMYWIWAIYSWQTVVQPWGFVKKHNQGMGRPCQKAGWGVYW